MFFGGKSHATIAVLLLILLFFIEVLDVALYPIMIFGLHTCARVNLRFLGLVLLVTLFFGFEEVWKTIMVSRS